MASACHPQVTHIQTQSHPIARLAFIHLSRVRQPRALPPRVSAFPTNGPRCRLSVHRCVHSSNNNSSSTSLTLFRKTTGPPHHANHRISTFLPPIRTQATSQPATALVFPRLVLRRPRPTSNFNSRTFRRLASTRLQTARRRWSPSEIAATATPRLLPGTQATLPRPRDLHATITQRPHPTTPTRTTRSVA